MSTDDPGSRFVDLELTANWREYALLVAVANPATVEGLMRTARAVAADRGGEVVVLTVVETDDPGGVSEDDAGVEAARTLLDRATDAGGADVPVSTLLKAGSDPAAVIRSTAADLGADQVLLGWDSDPAPLADVVLGRVVDGVAAGVDSDVLVQRVGDDPRPVDAVLVPVAGGVHQALTVATAAAIARAHDAVVHLVSVVGPGAPPAAADDRAAILEAAAATVEGVPVETRVLEGQDTARRVVDATHDHDLTVVGATGKGALEELVFDSVTARITRDADGPVVVAKRPTGVSLVARARRWVASRLGGR